jgi:Family of unknown function (DUF6527)
MIIRRILNWLESLFAPPARRVQYIEGDELPAVVPPLTVLVAREEGTLWSAAMRCPCGCGRRLEVMLLPGVEPRWDLYVDRRGRPTLHPSIWLQEGCRSHFWLRGGRIEWSRK